ncbi:MAG TPA: ATP-dependent sacrificial sulfur transferase LarE [Phycisphaerales bacterium]|nr:ATP-dependent sacrificial sulfur transferase LarE [Phycisphaerales bacterium]
MDTDAKYSSLKEILRSLGKVVLAYSGGVDSTFLLKAAVDTLGADNVIAALAVSGSLGKSQYARAIEMAEFIGANLVEVNLGEVSDSQYSANKADRCFHCKGHLFRELLEIAKNENIEHVIYGSNAGDMDDYRPGHRAAEVYGVIAPMAQANLTKADIRELSRQAGLKTADIPASPCLASRISYGTEITDEKLQQVDQAEDFLRESGFVEFRVRHHGEIARIEVAADDIERIAAADMRDKVTARLKDIGFKFVSLDLTGFQSGSLNDMLTENEKAAGLKGS